MLNSRLVPNWVLLWVLSGPVVSSLPSPTTALLLSTHRADHLILFQRKNAPAVPNRHLHRLGHTETTWEITYFMWETRNAGLAPESV